jgi:CheY-like chemotaxis protein
VTQLHAAWWAWADGGRERFPQLPVLTMSGHVEDPRQQAALSAGRYAFLPKPFSLPGLLLRLREVLEAAQP